MTTSTVDVTAGTGTHVATYDISEDAVTKKVQRVVLNDSAGTTITQTSGALDINVKSGGNSNGLAAAANAAPVIPATTTAVASVTPTVTASAYTAGNIMGGIMTFASLLDSVRFAGIVQSIKVKFKGTVVTGNVTLTLFKASPSNGTYADHTAGTWNAADMANLVGVYQLAANLSPQGTMTVYALTGIGDAVVGASQSLFGILTVAGTPTPASTSDLTVDVAVLPG